MTQMPGSVKNLNSSRTFGTLSNSLDPDQTLQHAASDQGLHCLLKLQD